MVGSEPTRPSTRDASTASRARPKHSSSARLTRNCKWIVAGDGRSESLWSFWCSKMAQMQQMRLTASNMLLTSIQINQLIRDSEADGGQLAANSSEDAELEEDDG